MCKTCDSLIRQFESEVRSVWQPEEIQECSECGALYVVVVEDNEGTVSVHNISKDHYLVSECLSKGFYFTYKKN